MTAIYKEKCLAPSERGQCFSSLPNTNIQAINISCLLACEPNLNMCTKRVFLSLSLQASKLRCSIVLISKMGIPFDIIIYKSREIFIYTQWLTYVDQMALFLSGFNYLPKCYYTFTLSPTQSMTNLSSKGVIPTYYYTYLTELHIVAIKATINEAIHTTRAFLVV